MLHANVCKVNYATKAGEIVVKKLLYDTNTPKGKICCFIFFCIKNPLFILNCQIEKGSFVIFLLNDIAVAAPEYFFQFSFILQLFMPNSRIILISLFRERLVAA